MSQFANPGSSGRPLRLQRISGLLRFAGLAVVVGLAAIPQAPRAEGWTAHARATITEAPPVVETSVPVSNASLARLFTALTFDMEWGESRTHLARYEAPVTVELDGAGSSAYAGFVDEYLALLRNRSGVDIARRSRSANLHVRFVGGGFARTAPSLACMATPGDVAWESFADDPMRHSGRALLHGGAIEHMTIFIPHGTGRERVESCLLEEIAQALGPANDLYGVGETIFNDDDAHLWPTAVDYLVLRVLYSPELRTGMDREAAERSARAVLDRINPRGRSAPEMAVPQEYRMLRWRNIMQDALSRTADRRTGVELAEKALRIAAAEAPESPYHCFSLTMLARLTGSGAAGRVLDILGRADAVCRAAHGPGDIRVARVALHRASLIAGNGSARGAVRITEVTAPVYPAHAEAGEGIDTRERAEGQGARKARISRLLARSASQSDGLAWLSPRGDY